MPMVAGVPVWRDILHLRWSVVISRDIVPIWRRWLMEKNQLIIQAILQAHMSPAEAATHFGVSRRWVYELMRRYRTQGEEGLAPRSRAPHSSPQTTTRSVQQRIVALRRELSSSGLDAGAETIAWHLEREGLSIPALSTIHRILRAEGLVVDEPHKRPRSSWHRFEAHQPNETWQSDFTHWALADGTDVEILNFLDDHSRLLLYCRGHQPVTGPVVLEAFLETTQIYGFPCSTLTDNGMVYTARFAGGKGGLNGFERTLRDLGIIQKNGKPNHPQTQGKIERFHQTLKRWLSQRAPAVTLVELNAELLVFSRIYNIERPHRALGRRTPDQAYAALPKAFPQGSGAGKHYRVRTDRIDATGTVTLRHHGTLLHLGVGRAHAGKSIAILVTDNEAAVFETDTGEVLADFTLDATKTYQPKKKKSPVHPDRPPEGTMSRQSAEEKKKSPEATED